MSPGRMRRNRRRLGNVQRNRQEHLRQPLDSALELIDQYLDAQGAEFGAGRIRLGVLRELQPRLELVRRQRRDGGEL